MYAQYFDRVWDTFEEVDADGNQQLSLEEFRSATSKFGRAIMTTREMCSAGQGS